MQTCEVEARDVGPRDEGIPQTVSLEIRHGDLVSYIEIAVPEGEDPRAVALWLKTELSRLLQEKLPDARFRASGPELVEDQRPRDLRRTIDRYGRGELLDRAAADRVTARVLQTRTPRPQPRPRERRPKRRRVTSGPRNARAPDPPEPDLDELAVGQLALPVGPNDCLDCGADTHALGEYFMCVEEVWLEAHPDDKGMLCVPCVERRLGRALVPEDFTDCPLNRRDDWSRSERLQARLVA
jgi:hypothetical protein